MRPRDAAIGAIAVMTGVCVLALWHLTCRLGRWLLPLLVVTGCAMAPDPDLALQLALIPPPAPMPDNHTSAAEPRDDPHLHVSTYALSACDTRDAWLPERGAIDDIQFWRALRREQWAKDTCSDKHDVLREQVKALLGVIRGQ